MLLQSRNSPTIYLKARFKCKLRSVGVCGIHLLLGFRINRAIGYNNMVAETLGDIYGRLCARRVYGVIIIRFRFTFYPCHCPYNLTMTTRAVRFQSGIDRLSLAHSRLCYACLQTFANLRHFRDKSPGLRSSIFRRFTMKDHRSSYYVPLLVRLTKSMSHKKGTEPERILNIKKINLYVRNKTRFLLTILSSLHMRLNPSLYCMSTRDLFMMVFCLLVSVVISYYELHISANEQPINRSITTTLSA